MPISSPTRSKHPSTPTGPLFRECERKRITKTDSERKTESESLWSGLVEPFSHNVLPNIQDGAERNYSERIISKDRGEEMLWLTPSKLEPQKPFPSIPPLYLFVTLIHFWHRARAFSRVQKKIKKYAGTLTPMHLFFSPSITSSSVLDVTDAAP